MPQPTQTSATGPARNNLARVALFTGIAALVLSLVLIGGLLGVVAVILGIIAVTRPGRVGASIAGIVTGLLAIPLSFVSLLIWVAVFVPHFSGRVDDARRAGTIADIVMIKGALNTFELDCGRMPSSAEGLAALLSSPPGLAANWKGPYLDSLPTDKWGFSYIYRFPGNDDPTTFDLIAVGQDGQEGTSDDIDRYTHR